MIRLSLSEFEEYCMAYMPYVFVFCSDNQPNFDLKSIQYESRYSEVLINKSANRLGFRGESGLLCFNDVVYVDVYDDEDCIGLFFQITCKARGRGTSSYVMLADRKYIF